MRGLLIAAVLGPIFLGGSAPTTTPPDPADEFITLAESITFGPSGSIVDLTDRFAYPPYIEPKTDWTGWTENTSLKDGGCSTNSDTWTALKNAITAATDNTRIWLPDDCKVLAFITPAVGGGGSANYTIPDTKDGLALYCADPTVCGLELRYTTSVSPQWDYTAGSANAAQLRNWLFSVGSSQSASLQSCSWVDTDGDGYDVGTKKIELGCSVSLTDNCTDIYSNPSGGASVQTSGSADGWCDSGGSVPFVGAWGPDDLVRLTVTRIKGFGTANFNVVAKVTCVNGSVSGASDKSGSDCTEVGDSDDNTLQIDVGLPMDYAPAAYFWGVNAGTGFTTCTSSTNCGDTQIPDTYAATSGHTVHQIERKNGSSPTDNVAENIYFTGIGWTLYPEFIGGAYVRVLDAFNVHFYQNDFDCRVGAQNCITVGGATREASHVSIHSSDFSYGSFKTTCYAEITAISIVDSDTLSITYDNSATCNFQNAGGDDSAGFTSDVDEAKLAGKAKRKTASVLVSSSPARRSFTVDVDSTTGVNECAEGTGDPCEGIAIDLDKYDNAMIYCNNQSSNVQVVNNVFHNATQSQIMQSGCAQYVFAYNYTTKDTDFGRGRGPFHHGNAGAPGHLFEGNDSSHSFQPFDTSNRRPTDNGEGVAHTYYKNRCREVSTTGTVSTYGANSGTCFNVASTPQMGGSNEDWTIWLNAGKEMVSGTMDDDRNYNSDPDYPTTTAAPHNIYKMWWYRNRCTGTGCNQDDNFDAGNTSTVRDNGPLGTDDVDESATVPAAWSGEIGEEPTSLFFTEVPEFFTGAVGECELGKIGAYYDDFSGTLCKIPAQLRFEE